MSTQMDEKVDEKVVTTDDGDHDRFAHYFSKADIERAYIDGAEITALCGKKDIPLKDFTGYEICPTCKETYEKMKD